MKRREFIALAGGAAAWPIAARAQQTAEVPRVGFVYPGPKGAVTPRIEALLSGLRVSGYAAPAHTLFASATEGFRLGGANREIPLSICGQELNDVYHLTQSPGTFDSDSLWSYEIGNKSRFFDNRLPYHRAGTGIDLYRADVPLLEVVEQSWHLRRIRDGATHVPVDRRVAVEQRAAREYPRAGGGIGIGRNIRCEPLLAAGARAFLTKPIAIRELLETFDVFFDEHGIRASAA